MGKEVIYMDAFLMALYNTDDDFRQAVDEYIEDQAAVTEWPPIEITVTEL